MEFITKKDNNDIDIDNITSMEGLLSERLLTVEGRLDDHGGDSSFLQQQHNNNNDNNINNNADVEVAHIVVDHDGGGGTTQGQITILQGEKQPNQYRDVWAAILFVMQFVVIAYLGIVWGVPAMNYAATAPTTSSDSNTKGYTTTIHFGGLLGLCILSSIAALLISGGALAFMTRNAQHIIQISLAFTIACDGLVVVYFILSWNVVGFILSILALLLALWYCISVWHRIPFAAANLETAVTAIRSNGGIVLVGYGITIFVNMLFATLWILAWLGVYVRYTANTCQKGDPDVCLSHTNPITIVLFLLSFYWTMEVGKNVLHVSVAGVVGTWWFVPDDASSFCSPAITDSFRRATTYSAGSICLGSLLTASLQVLYHLVHTARRQRSRNDLLLCIIECILRFLERLVAYFNKWAYVYIGLYGYDYLTAGKKVMDLFMARGWTTIINDDLVHRVLVLMSFVIGILTGVFGLFLGALHPNWVDEFGTGGIIPFVLPCIIGTSMSYILMGTIASAVDTVIVAFCEAPLEFERNHPGLYVKMTSAWNRIYPQEFGRQ